MTIPSIFASTRRTEVETRLKQTYSILNNALTLAVKDNGPINTWDEIGSTTVSSQSIPFFINYLSPYLYFAQKYDVYKISDLGYYEVKMPNGQVYIANGGAAVGAVLNNGVLIISTSSSSLSNAKRYASIVYYIDINGPKKPNIIGKDVFPYNLSFISKNPKFEMYGNTDYKVTFKQNVEEITEFPQERKTLMSNCKSSGVTCGALIQRNGWKIPKDYPLSI